VWPAVRLLVDPEEEPVVGEAVVLEWLAPESSEKTLPARVGVD
jgi:hypothetical protein